VTVDWQTASEVDVVRMEIERATVTRTAAGMTEGSYQVVERKSPIGNVTTGATYRVIDPAVEAGREYSYRLVTVNADGQRVVEETRLVKVTSSGVADYSLTVLPNPLSLVTTGTVRYTAPTGDRVRVVLYDATGRQVKVLVDESSTGSGSLELNASELTSGAYSVRLESTNGAPVVQKLTVEK
jgi:hypothetical protein